VLGGRATLSPETERTLEGDARRAEIALMPTAAKMLRELGHAARAADRATTGARRRADADLLARAYLRAAEYERHTRESSPAAAGASGGATFRGGERSPTRDARRPPRTAPPHAVSGHAHDETSLRLA